MRTKRSEFDIVNQYATYVMTDDPRHVSERFTALTRLIRIYVNCSGVNIVTWMASPEATKFSKLAHDNLGVAVMEECAAIGHDQFRSGEAALIVQEELDKFAATLKGNELSIFEKQRTKHEQDYNAPRVVPPTLFLPKNRDEALRMIAEALYAIDDENSMSDRHTCYSQEIRELLDLIERS